MIEPPVFPVKGQHTEKLQNACEHFKYHLILQSMPIIAVSPPQFEKVI